MKNRVLFMVVLFLLSTFRIFSQENIELTAKDSIVKSSWVFGIGFNAVDDSGDMFDQLLDFKDEWNMVPFPSRLNIGRNFSNGIGLEAIATYNKYKSGKVVDNIMLNDDIDYYAIDGRVTYALNKIWGDSKWFDPYLGAGLGYTDANNQGRGTYNGIVGLKIWFSDRFGLDFNSSGKWAMNKDKATNHLQHAVSGLYRFKIKKGLTKKGEEKLARLQELEKERKRVQDSIDAADRAREEALAERLAEEREKARLAAAEKAKMDAENQRKQQIKDAISALGHVYFGFDSSYFDKHSKTILDALSDILKTNPTVELKIGSHTDSRGPSNYNKWLSKKRVDRTRKYLISKGIESNRLEIEAHGEEHLTNECDDSTYCTEDKHKMNRRSEFIVTDL